MGWEWTNYRIHLCFALLAVLASGVDGQGYFGVRIGPLQELHHAVKGDVYAVDSRTIHIRGFSYDGSAPDAFFYAGTTPEPSENGFVIPNENGGKEPLGRYRNQDITLTLPDGKTFKDIDWISVWCRAFTIDFGSVRVNSNLDYPRPQKIDAIPTLEHGVSSDRIVVVDAQTFLIPNFSYDGAAPDGHFWVGKGSAPGPTGSLVPDENGSEEPLKRYSGKTIVITLPGHRTVFDIDYLSIWCETFYADFGHVRIPKNLNVPPSLKMLGVAPQSQRAGYSYQPPSSARPAFSYEPQTKRPAYKAPTTPRPSYSPPTRPPTTPKLSYRPRQPASPAYSPSPFTTVRPVYPRSNTKRPPYQFPTTRRPRSKPTTRRPHYKPLTTTRRPYPPLTTTRRPYNPPTTTRRPYSFPITTPRPRYRRPHFDSDESREVSGSRRSSNAFKGHPPQPTVSRDSHFSVPQRTTSSQHKHFGGSARRHRGDDDDDSDEDHSEESSRRFPSSSHRFGSSSESSESRSDSKKGSSSFHFSNGAASSFFDIYG